MRRWMLARACAMSEEAPTEELQATLQQLGERPVMSWSRSDLPLALGESKRGRGRRHNAF